MGERGELSMAESITAGFSRGVAGLDSPGLLGPGPGGASKVVTILIMRLRDPLFMAV